MADREKRMISTLGVTVLLGLCIGAGIRSDPVEFQETGYVQRKMRMEKKSRNSRTYKVPDGIFGGDSDLLLWHIPAAGRETGNVTAV